MRRIPKRIRQLLVWLIWLCLWELAARWVHNRILMVGPAEAFLALWQQLPTAEFWRTILHSSIRICGGYLLAFGAGLLAGILSYKKWYLEEFLEPAVALLQSVPVASFVILALIWIGSENLAVLISFVIVFPVIYRNTLQGMRAVDPQLLEMAAVFEMPASDRFWHLYRPALLPYLMAGGRTACGMAWKSGVAAEVIGVPDLSIGEKLYMAKIYLSTAELFAWTFVVILISRLFERGFWRMLELLATDRGSGKRCRRIRKGADCSESRPACSVCLQTLSKSYGEKQVLLGLSLSLAAGEVYALMGASGAGKTTLLRILLGLEKEDGGTVSRKPDGAVSAVFQEDRLLEDVDAIGNITAAGRKRGLCCTPEEVLDGLLEPEAWQKRSDQLSGGMRRRVAIARALAVRSGFLLMDEPFTGLDEETKRRSIRQILKFQKGRTILVVTHQEEDARLLGAKLMRMETLNHRK